MKGEEERENGLLIQTITHYQLHYSRQKANQRLDATVTLNVMECVGEEYRFALSKVGQRKEGEGQLS